jgi:4-hydroxythreonine-4-phosphate dehydrogenase
MMSKPIAIIAGEPNSISSEIIFKSWLLRKKYFHKPIVIIGSIDLLNLQKKKLRYKINIQKVNKNFDFNKMNRKKLWVHDINYIQDKAFQKISKKTNKYIFRCFNAAIKLIKKKKILGIINCPVSKETLFDKKHQGITEFISKKTKSKGKEVMLIYNKKFSVSPLTTHISLKDVNKNIDEKRIVKNVITINNFYKKNFNIKPKIGILGINPHNFSKNINDKQKTIILAIKKIKNLKINIVGPIVPDSSFLIAQKNKIDVMLGMYHDQVLTTFKTLFKFDAINITLGLPFIRISPDHGIGTDILNKKKANPQSLIQSIKFFNKIK